MPKPHKITKLYAWIETRRDGAEAIPAVVSAGVALPLIGSDRARIESYFRHALDAALRPEIVSVRLVCFENLIEIEKLVG
jgi:hypothetical protein